MASSLPESVRGRIVRALHGACAAILLAVALSGCGEVNAIAVVNDTDEPYYLRYEGRWVWHVPPHSSGIGPANMESGGKQIEILRMDCSTYAGWGLHEPTTIVISANRPPEPLGGVSITDALPSANGACALH